jgi:hypothetical protein
MYGYIIRVPKGCDNSVQQSELLGFELHPHCGFLKTRKKERFENWICFRFQVVQ